LNKPSTTGRFNVPAYLISCPPEDGYDEEMDQYPENVGPLVEEFDGKYLVLHKEARALEGPFHPDHMVIIEFPSMDRLMEFYESDEYKPWLELRKKAQRGETSITITEA
jgi:uncharacterized protein (DUF1330 family)